MKPIDKIRARFQRLRLARDCGAHMTDEKRFEVFKVASYENWRHEYWLLTVELKQHKKELAQAEAEWQQLQDDREAAYEESVSANYAARGLGNIY